ncbi:Altered inheritance of mitochondria protein 24, mitochondrial [Neodidymelliopsis sp. IMI 364377]|nr:Altered inheritance of mitochondria protein 24, mitochondrial [Neodidymelliopsis sp. IMI 364377]
MLRPAASPWRSFAHRASAAAVRRRCINISATTSSTEPALDQALRVDAAATPAVSPGKCCPLCSHDLAPAVANTLLDAHFEVIGTPFSLLSVSLSASQTLFTRRGTLVGLSGKSENTLSTLSFLEPFRRAPVGIPFLYQKVSSTTPVTALVSTKSPISSIVTVNLDGRQDWVVSQRQALLAWTGHTLTLKPQYNVKLGLAHWGNTYITGRGLLALAGSGQIYQVQLKAGESYVAHPANVVAYTASATPPMPFRFKSSNFRFQVPDLGFGSLVQNAKFFRIMSQTATWRAISTTYYTLKTWMRRSIWGDRLFLRFEGPTTMLLQSRGSRLSDVLTLKDVNEIAESQPGAVQDAVDRKIKEEIKQIGSGTTAPGVQQSSVGAVKYATIRNGKAEFANSPPSI